MSSTHTLTKSKKPLTERFYEAVREEYKRLNNVKRNGVRVYSQEFIVAKIADKYYRSPATIQNILYNRV